MSTSRISQLAQRIAANTAKIDNYLNSQGLPQPSFALDAPLKPIIPDDEVELKKARQEVLADTLELRTLIQGPREFMSSFSVSSSFFETWPSPISDSWRDGLRPKKRKRVYLN